MTGSARALCVVVVVAACQPWYRDDERAGRYGLPNDDRATTVVRKADAASASGDHAGAARLYRQALELDPDLGPAYVALAKEELALGDRVAARAAAARELARWSGDKDMRVVLASVDVSEDRTADAIDDLGASSLYEASQYPDLAKVIGDLSRAASADHASNAVPALAAWLSTYGVPDHRMLRDARERVAEAIWKEAASDPTLAGLARVPELADREIAAGHVQRALALYAETFRLLPARVLEQHADGFLKAARQGGDVFAIDATAYRSAMEGDENAKRGELGKAIRAYRRAVALAPWWPEAHRNLSALLAAIGRDADAKLETEWADRLSR